MKKVRFLTRVAIKIRAWRWAWLSRILGIIQNEVIVPALVAIGQEGLALIERKILQESYKDIPGREKFQNVYDSVRQAFTVDSIGNDLLNNIIQNLVSKMKARNEIE